MIEKHVETMHARRCATLGPDWWRVLARPASVVVAPDGLLVLAAGDRALRLAGAMQFKPFARDL